MWDIRQNVSLLVAHNHTEVDLYPMGALFDEADIIRKRIDRQTASEAILLRSAILACFSEEGAKNFKGLTDSMDDD